MGEKPKYQKMYATHKIKILIFLIREKRNPNIIVLFVNFRKIEEKLFCNNLCKNATVLFEQDVK